MKRITICIIILVTVIGLMAGCFSGGGTKINGFRIYERETVVSNMGEFKFNSGIVYAESIVSISQCELYVPFSGSSMGRAIIAEYWDQGVKLDVQIDMVQEYDQPGENECFSILSTSPQTSGGTVANITGSVIGKSRLVVSYNGETASIPIITFDAFSLLDIPVGSGLKINTDGSKTTTTNITECIIGKNSYGIYAVSQRVYKISASESWVGLANIKTVEPDRLVTRTANLGTSEQYYIVQITGGYIKLYCSGNSIFWEIANGLEFR